MTQADDTGQATARTKVCHLITDLDVAGAERAMSRFVVHTKDGPFDQRVACLLHGDGEIPDQLRERGLPVIDLRMSAKWRIDALARLYRWLRAERPAILHTWMFHANLAGRCVGRLARVPIVVCSRRIDRIGSDWRERINRATNRLCDRTIAVAERVREIELERAGAAPDRVVTIHNGVPLQSKPPDEAARRQLRSQWSVDDDDVLFGVVARFRPQKGLRDLIDAFARLRPQRARLLLVGDGDLRSQLEADVAAKGIGDRVRFTGLRADVEAILPSLDVFVLPSHWEGLPNAVLEAMAAGLPVVATHVGGTPELVVDGETGALVPPRSPSLLADAMQDLLDDPQRRARYGAAGRSRAEAEFTLDRMAQRTQDLYRELLAEKRDPRAEEPGAAP